MRKRRIWPCMVETFVYREATIVCTSCSREISSNGVVNPYISTFAFPAQLDSSPHSSSIELHGRFKCSPLSHSNSALTCMDGHVLHLCKLYSDYFPCHSPSWSFSVHTSHPFFTLSCPISDCTSYFPYDFLMSSCPFWHVCFDTTPLLGPMEVPLLFGTALFCTFTKPKNLS
jgi:hypothetical protein